MLGYRKLQRVANIIWPKYNVWVDRLNYNALHHKFELENKTVPRLSDRDELFKALLSPLKNAAIDYLEFGVYRGESIKKVITLNKNPKSRFIGFDTFTGLPEDWYGPFKRGAFDAKGEVPRIEDSRVSFIKGLFQETLPQFLKSYTPNNEKLIVMLDADLYTSTLYVLTMLNDILLPGAILIFDDFADPIGEFKAYYDFYRSYMREFKPLYFVYEKNILVKAAFEVLK